MIFEICTGKYLIKYMYIYHIIIRFHFASTIYLCIIIFRVARVSLWETVPLKYSSFFVTFANLLALETRASAYTSEWRRERKKKGKWTMWEEKNVTFSLFNMCVCALGRRKRRETKLAFDFKRDASRHFAFDIAFMHQQVVVTWKNDF